MDTNLLEVDFQEVIFIPYEILHIFNLMLEYRSCVVAAGGCEEEDSSWYWIHVFPAKELSVDPTSFRNHSVATRESLFTVSIGFYLWYYPIYLYREAH